MSLCTLQQFRRQVAKTYMTVEWPALGVNTLDLAEFGTKLESHASYRAHVSDMNGAFVDMTWKARCRASNILAFDLLVEPQRGTNIEFNIPMSAVRRSNFCFDAFCPCWARRVPKPSIQIYFFCDSGHCIHR